MNLRDELDHNRITGMLDARLGATGAVALRRADCSSSHTQRRLEIATKREGHTSH